MQNYRKALTHGLLLSSKLGFLFDEIDKEELKNLKFNLSK